MGQIGGGDQTQQHVVQSAGEVHNVFIAAEASMVASGHVTKHERKPSLAEQRQKFHFDYLKHAMKQSEWMFLLSVFAMTAGAVAMFVGMVLGFVHAGSPNHGFVPYVTGCQERSSAWAAVHWPVARSAPWRI